MVAFVDSLERKGLVSRHPDPRDRRRNIVELTDAGRTTLAEGVEASDSAESALLKPLGAEAAQSLRDALAAIVIDADR
jgi:DNA-binding MarR family transcriptional regulator